MIRTSVLKHWLVSHPIRGRRALLATVLAVAIPTIIRLSVEGFVTGIPVTTYVPFVLLSAVLLGWLNASVVAVISAAIGDTIFVGSPYRLFEAPGEAFVIGIFLVVSAMIIGFVHLVRQMLIEGHACVEQSGIIFSLENGQAWASRPGLDSRVRLGPEEEVAEMMRDFLAQLEVGKRLNRPSVSGWGVEEGDPPTKEQVAFP